MVNDAAEHLSALLILERVAFWSLRVPIVQDVA